ncbi:MAG TPA: DUF2892 domain-containing protein [Elusimicrobia bacterium]|nr:MAG: hypothetical protein A2016_04595 [Elusimicrobia bacterium GWF2_62_30]HBA59383.1 DUF2892 domain-containing protein [Elusimicrobiota bacterium]
MFAKNVGTTDKVIRWIVGLALAFVAYRSTGTWAIVAGVAAALAILTALLGRCGLYVLLGITTCPLDKPAAPPENKP